MFPGIFLKILIYVYNSYIFISNSHCLTMKKDPTDMRNIKYRIIYIFTRILIYYFNNKIFVHFRL